jgi:hypothetical protein
VRASQQPAGITDDRAKLNAQTPNSVLSHKTYPVTSPATSIEPLLALALAWVLPTGGSVGLDDSPETGPTPDAE